MCRNFRIIGIFKKLVVQKYQGVIVMSYKINANYNFMNNYMSTQTENNGSSILSDYYAIKNGSYYKLAKKFYGTDAGKKAIQAQFSGNVSDQKTTKMAKNNAEDAANAINALMDDKLYNKVETKDADGKVTSDYDRKAILDKLKKFTDAYNGVVENTGDLEDTTVLKNAVSMVNQTKIYAGSLSRVGVTIGSDNKLKIDEDAFNKADLVEMKNLFSKGTSFGTNTRTKMLQVGNSATSALNSQGGIYSSQAVANNSIGNMFDTIF